MFNYIANTNNYFMKDLGITVVRIREGSASSMSTDRQGTLLLMQVLMIDQCYAISTSFI